MVPCLNSQMNNEALTLFRNDVTETRNPKYTVNNCFYDTHSVYIF